MVALIRAKALEQVVTDPGFSFALEPTITALASGYVMTWYVNGGGLDGSGHSVRAQLFDANGVKIGSEIGVNTTTDLDQNLSAVTALSGGGFAIAWVNQPNSIRSQIFDAGGAKVGGELTLGAIGFYDNGLRPAITTLSSGDFAVTWGSGGSISGRIVSATGVLKSQFSATSGGFGNEPEIVARVDGGFTVFWNDQSGLNGDPDIGLIAQHFTAAGAQSGAPFIVNSTLPGTQFAPASTQLANGATVVAWTFNGPNDSNTGGIRAQIIQSDGTRLANDLVVSSLVPNFQSDPEIAALSWGGFIVTWADGSQGTSDFSTPSIRAQIFDVDGTRIGDEVRLNSAVNQTEQKPYLAVLGDNTLIAAWAESNSGGILQRQYTLPSVGTLGDDTTQLSGTEQSFAARAGNDTIYGAAGADIVDGGLGNDVLHGLAGNDVLGGASGDDLIDGGIGLDTLEGGLGNDIFYVDAAGDSVIETAGEGDDLIFAGASYTLGLGVSVETLTTRNSAGTESINFVGNELANTIVGNAGANILNGAAGTDLLVGLAGDDVLIGGEGSANTLQGGLGNDSYYVSAAGDSVIEFSGEGNDTVRTTLDVYVLGGNVENLVYVGSEAFVGLGDAFENVLLGGANDDILNGQDGADILLGAGGNDVLIGGNGSNTLQGGEGNDLYYVTSIGDTIVEADGAGYDTVITSLSAYTTSGVAEALVFNGQGNFLGTGSAGNDVIVGNSGNDELYGLNGNDSLNGNNGADYIFGGSGNDQINGGLGNDRLIGGTGADTFVIADAGVDTILDFEAGSDRILIDRASFSGLSAGPLAEGALTRGDAALDPDDRIVYNSATGALLYDADGTGQVAAVQFAIVSVPTGVLAASDFFVI